MGTTVPHDKTMSLDELISRLQNIRNSVGGSTPVAMNHSWGDPVGWFYTPLINVFHDGPFVSLVPDHKNAQHQMQGLAGPTPCRGVIPEEENEVDDA